MNLEWIRLLEIQRDLYRIPRGMVRFREYLRVMVDETGDELRLPPLVAMNPMGKDHIPALLDALLALDAESVAARALAEASEQVADVPGTYKAGLVIADDLMGGWTNRFACEFNSLSPVRCTRGRGWMSIVLWSSEPAAAQTIRQLVLTTVYRAAYLLKHGVAHTLRALMAQEGHVRALAGCTEPALDPDDLEYTREVVAPLLDAQDMRTMMECLFGDAAGRTLGFTPRGLSPWAGIALALHDARTQTGIGRDVRLSPTS
jgi:hypothetical protein